MTLLANHALVDGIHIARFYENLGPGAGRPLRRGENRVLNQERRERQVRRCIVVAGIA